MNGASSSITVTNGGQEPHGHSHAHGHGHSHAHGHGHPVPTRESFPYARLVQTAVQLLLHPSTYRISALLALNLLSLGLVMYWVAATESMALSAFSYISWFHSLNLLTCYLTQWIRIQNQKFVHRKMHDISAFNLGYARFEVLAVFSSTILSQLGALFLMKEALERIIEAPEIHTGRLILGAATCCVSQLITTCCAPSTALSHVFEVSTSSWLQEHTADVSHSLCSVFPPLSTYLLPRINPLILLSTVSMALLFILDLIIEINSAHRADSFIALSLAIMIMGTMYPMTAYTGKILLQTTPTHILPQLDRYLREALTIDGVLEFKNEHFWTVSFGKLAGSMTARVRKDANEQVVLAQITDRLANIVWPLTIQIAKDDHQISQLQQTSLQFLRATPRANPVAFRAKASPLTSGPSTPGGGGVNGSATSANGSAIIPDNASQFLTSTPNATLSSPTGGEGGGYSNLSGFQIQPPQPLPQSFHFNSNVIPKESPMSESAKLK